MDSHKKENKDLEESTSDLKSVSSHSTKSKKSSTKLVAVLLAVIIVVGAIGGGLWYYKSYQDKKVAEQAAATKAAQTKQLTPEEQITKDLNDNLKKQREALQQNDDTKAITNSTAAAISVGRNLHEDQLKD